MTATQSATTAAVLEYRNGIDDIAQKGLVGVERFARWTAIAIIAAALAGLLCLAYSVGYSKGYEASQQETKETIRLRASLPE